MGVSQVHQRVQAIADTADDPEAAHELQDRLFGEVPKEIASESSDLHARTLAAKALRAQEIDFERWYA